MVETGSRMGKKVVALIPTWISLLAVVRAFERKFADPSKFSKARGPDICVT